MFLLNLGTILGADLLANDMHNLSSFEHEISGPAGHSETHTYKNDTESKDLSEKTCFDPCHAGGSHFGHCSVMFRAVVTNVGQHLEDQLIGIKPENVLEEIYLEGHRRPPKHT